MRWHNLIPALIVELAAQTIIHVWATHHWSNWHINITL